jgi:hypothetical protein
LDINKLCPIYHRLPEFLIMKVLQSELLQVKYMYIWTQRNRQLEAHPLDWYSRSQGKERRGKKTYPRTTTLPVGVEPRPFSQPGPVF